MTTNATFGSIFVAPKMEENLLAVLKEWLGTYLSEVERQYGLDPCSLARPKYWGTSVDDTLEPGERYPAIVVVSPGTNGTPDDTGGGNVAAWYDLTVAVSVMASNEMGARRVAGLYAGAIRAAVMQHGSVGGAAEATMWLGEEFLGEPGTQRNRSRAGALVHFRVRIGDAVNSQAGPAFPAPDDPCAPLADLPTVETVTISVDHE